MEDGTTCNQGWLWTPSENATVTSSPPPLSVRYLRFQNFVNVYPTNEPGAEPPGRLPDPPNLVADHMRTMIAGQDATDHAGTKAGVDKAVKDEVEMSSALSALTKNHRLKL